MEAKRRAWEGGGIRGVLIYSLNSFSPRNWAPWSHFFTGLSNPECGVIVLPCMKSVTYILRVWERRDLSGLVIWGSFVEGALSTKNSKRFQKAWGSEQDVLHHRRWKVYPRESKLMFPISPLFQPVHKICFPTSPNLKGHGWWIY